jgi:hypothetical protein
MTWDDISARMTNDARVTSDHISATTTYVMWREEQLGMSVYSKEYA